MTSRRSDVWKIILLQDVDKVGSKGEVANVSEGYARNYLFPRKLAEMATAGRDRPGPQDHGAEGRPRAPRSSSGPKRSATCWPRPFSPSPRRSARGEQLFGSITNADIATAIYAARKIRIDKRNVDLEEPIKMVGTYMVKVDVNSSLEPAEVKVIVVPEEHKARGTEMAAGNGGPGGEPGGDYTLPQNLDAELSVLGASMLTPNVIPAVSEIIRPHYFYRQGHQRIFEVIEDLFSRGEPVDPITVSRATGQQGQPRGGGRAGVHPQPGDGGPRGHQRPLLRGDRQGELLPALAHQGGRGDHRDGLPAGAARPLELIDRAEQMVFDISAEPGGRGVRAHRRADHRELLRTGAAHDRGAPHHRAARPASATWTP